ncbi:acetyl-CoA carboxylase biotin carboxyl carrier protein [Nocardia abscessus]|uniref:acetyl-CoA carboxylase biotin carboxyl carrier protein n=1 Tax=Nocardia abscessus TaxID=120957 RepID=UPI0024588FB2|nr:biotin/lipoyl-containing protein [Nocardia abscessus]
MFDGGPGAEPAGRIDAWLIIDDRAELIGQICRLARAYDIEAAVGSYRYRALHRAEGPGAPPLVEIGSRVSEGTALCIIEVMKLRNELVSDIDGTVAAILAGEGQEVQYGQALMIIRP